MAELTTEAVADTCFALRLSYVRSALYMPASNDRAVAKSAQLDADCIIFDLEDAVAESDKERARSAAIAACLKDHGDRIIAVRCNGFETPDHAGDVAAIAESAADAIVVPKVECLDQVEALSLRTDKPIIAMIETCIGLYNARAIAAHPAVFGLFAGTNDLARELGLDMETGRMGLTLALQMIVLAAKASAKSVFDGVNNQLDDMTALERETMEARRFGFTGKTAIHPRQLDAINRLFSPSSAQIEEAEALLTAANGGAERFRGRMVESMHVAAAEELLARAKTNNRQ